MKYCVNKGVCMPFYDEKTNKLVVLYFVDCLRMKYDCLYFRKSFASFYAEVWELEARKGEECVSD